MSQPLPVAIRSAIDSANVGDVDAFAAAFVANEGCVDHWGRRVHGASAIKRWSADEFIGKQASIKVIHYYYPDSNIVVVIAQVQKESFNGPMTFTFHLERDQILRMDITA